MRPEELAEIRRRVEMTRGSASLGARDRAALLAEIDRLQEEVRALTSEGRSMADWTSHHAADAAKLRAEVDRMRVVIDAVREALWLHNPFMAAVRAKVVLIEAGEGPQ